MRDKFKLWIIKNISSKYLEILGNKGISTTNIINDIYSYNRLNESPEEKTGWNKIGELKGKESTNNLTQLNGYENTDFYLNMCYKNIIYTLDIKSWMWWWSIFTII